MDRYLELRLRPDPEFPITLLLGALYSKLHKALYELRRDDIGVSFPAFGKGGKGLGDILRLHGTAKALDVLQSTPWLSGMRDHLASGTQQTVPDSCHHRVVRRMQSKSNPERLRRRLMKRHGIDAATAEQRIPDTKRETLDLPFIRLTSTSTGERYLLFIAHGPLQTQPTPGRFNNYGLSQDATIPWF